MWLSANSYVHLGAGEMLVPHEVDGVRLMSMGFINQGAMPLRGAKVGRRPRAFAAASRISRLICSPLEVGPV